MISNPKVIVMERPSGSVSIAITEGSDKYQDAHIMVAASPEIEGDSISDALEVALYYAGKRILELENGGYITPPSSEAKNS